MLPAMAFPWDALIASGATLVGTLGGVGLKGRQDAGREERLADRADRRALGDRQRAAYVGLVVAARASLRNLRALRLAYNADLTDTPEAKRAFDESPRLSDALNAAAVTVQIVAPEAADAARRVYAAAKVVDDMYQERSIALVGWERATGMKDGQGYPAFDIARAESLCDALDAEISDFITAVRPEGN